MFISDAAINSSTEDILGRNRFSEALAKTIIELKDKKSIVIGLYGKWGVGKTSVVNLILDYIKNAQNIPAEKKPTIIEFNPWNFSEQNQLILAFFNEIANRLQHIDVSKKSKEIANKLKLYGAFLSSTEVVSEALRYLIPFSFLLLGSLILGSAYLLELIPIVKVLSVFLIAVGFISALSKKVLFALSDFFIEKSKITKKTLRNLKCELNKLISERAKRLIIVIDDIDRLNQKEIKQMLQLVKINADFPNTVYLLPFEREIIEKNLEEQKGVSGKEYLEKIVQVDFDIPIVQKSRLYNFLLTQLDTIVRPVPGEIWDQTRWGNLFHSGFKNLFNSLRDTKRFINSLRFNFMLIQKEGSFELNPIDFIGLESIRVFAPEVYRVIKDKKHLLTTTGSYTGRDTAQEEQTRKQEIENTINQTRETIRESVKNIIFQLFPQVDGLFRNMHYTNSFQQEWTRTCRICSSEIFDRYFILDIPEGEIAQFEVERILEATKNKEQFAQEMDKFLKEGRIRKLLEKLEDYTDKFDLENAPNIIEPLLNITDELPTEERVGFFDIGSDMRIMRIIYHYLKRIDDKSKRSSILKEAIKNSKALYGCVQKVSIEIQGIEKKSDYERIILENQADEFKKLCVDKIKEFQKSNKLRGSSQLAYILYRWRDWGDKKDIQSFIAELIKDDESLIILLKNFLSRRSSHTLGDYVSRVIWKMDYKGLADFIDLEEAKKRLEKIKIDESQGEEKLAVETFLKNYDSRDKVNEID